MLRTCFILNIPYEYIGNENNIVNDLKKKNIAHPDRVELVKFSMFNYIKNLLDNLSSDCFYLKLTFPDYTMVDLLLERGLEFEKYPGLVLPCLEDVRLSYYLN